MNVRTRALRAACAGAFVLAASAVALAGDPWNLMPEAACEEAGLVDDLTYLILWITGVTFIGVQALLVWFLFAHRRRAGVRAKHTHGNHTVEMVWTVAPAAILVFLAVYQMGLWKDLKAAAPEDKANAVEVRIFAKQFKWNFWLPGPDGKWDTGDDVAKEGVLVVPNGRPVLAELRAMDVLHSFYLPNLRFKQDAVPGLHTKIWFRPTKLSVDRRPIVSSEGKPVKVEYWDIVCAELCGNGHTTMNGMLYVVSDEQYAAWIRGEDIRISPATTVTKPANFASLGPPYDFLWKCWRAQDDLTVKGPAPYVRRPFSADGDYKGGEDE